MPLELVDGKGGKPEAHLLVVAFFEGGGEGVADGGGADGVVGGLGIDEALGV